MDATATWLRKRLKERDAAIVTLKHENATLRGDVLRLEAELAELYDQLDGVLAERSRYAYERVAHG